MTVQLTCPHCNFSREVPNKDIPPEARQAICPRCGQRFAFSVPETEGALPVFEPAPDDRGRETREDVHAFARTGAPWEKRDELGFWSGIFQTIKVVLFSPKALFNRLSYDAGFRDPLAFGLLTGSIGSMFGLFWQFIIAAAGVIGLGDIMGWHVSGPLSMGVIFIVVMAGMPFFVMAGMFIYAGIMHLLLLVVRGGQHGFEGTFRVIAYAQAAQIWGLIPFVGGWIGSVWQLIVQVIGLREIHGTSYLRIFLALLIPVILVIVVVLSILVPLLYLLFKKGAVSTWF